MLPQQQFLLKPKKVKSCPNCHQKEYQPQMIEGKEVWVQAHPLGSGTICTAPTCNSIKNCNLKTYHVLEAAEKLKFNEMKRKEKLEDAKEKKARKTQKESQKLAIPHFTEFKKMRERTCENQAGGPSFQDWRQMAEDFLNQGPEKENLPSKTPFSMEEAKNTANRINSVIASKRFEKEQEEKQKESNKEKSDNFVIDLTTPEEIEILEKQLNEKKEYLEKITTKYMPLIEMVKQKVEDEDLDSFIVMSLLHKHFGQNENK